MDINYYYALMGHKHNGPIILYFISFELSIAIYHYEKLTINTYVIISNINGMLLIIICSEVNIAITYTCNWLS